tara:strand:- start:163 stop:591 length:429 start_codon:yes stop_codon:yes gene_type:complete
MIKYKLICKDCDNLFDSWFSSSIDYEKLKKKNFLNCNICNSLNVDKTLMSPSVMTTEKNITINNQGYKYKKIKKTIIEYQKFIKKNFNYVGENFAYKARTMHYKSKKTSKGIYGTATKKEFKELKEEGIEIESIPWIEDSTN